MQYLRFILFSSFLLLFSIIPAQADIACGTTISSGGTYTLEGNKSCDGAWVTISASSVIINSSGDYTVTYGGTSANSGIEFGAVVNTVTIDGIKLTQGTNGKSAIDLGNRAINSLTISNCTLTLGVELYSVIDIYETSGAMTGLVISGNTISLNKPTTGNSTKTHGISISDNVQFLIYSNTITLGNHVYQGRCSGISIEGAAGASGKIYSNTINLNNEDQGEGIRLWDADGVEVYSNTINMSTTGARGILIDGDSDSNLVHDNAIIMLVGGANENENRGIRLRYSSDNNSIYNNNISDTSGSGTYSKGIEIGEASNEVPHVGEAPTNNLFYKNTISVRNAPVYLYVGAQTGTQFYCNTLTQLSADYPAIYVYSGSSISGVDFSNETITNVSGYKVTFNLFYGSPADPIGFCSCGLAAGDFSAGESGTDWLITTSNCPYSCGGGDLNLRFTVPANQGR